MNTDKPDLFGPYAFFMYRAHKNILDNVCIQFNLEKQHTELPIHQMSIFEYIDEKHDEDYVFYKFMINNSKKAENLMPSVFISVNNKYMKSMFTDEYFKCELPKLIVNEWNAKEFKSLDFYSKNNEITCEHNDVIQSIHYFYKNEQLFKIIYSHKAFKEILKGIK